MVGVIEKGLDRFVGVYCSGETPPPPVVAVYYDI